jgi:hypothetical protein
MTYHLDRFLASEKATIDDIYPLPWIREATNTNRYLKRVPFEC